MSELPLPGPAEVAALRRLAVRLAAEAGRYVVTERPADLAVSATKSTALDVVTRMDTGSERLLRDRLAEHRPEDGVLGEEEGLRPGPSGLTWVLDPIDGTVNYLYDQPAYAVSVAVVVGDPTRAGAWQPVAGAVSNPRVGEVFHAGVGQGAGLSAMRLTAGAPAAELVDLDGPGGVRPLRVADPPALAEALVGTGFAYDRERRARQGQVALEVLLRCRDLRRIGAAALDLCAVAAGRLDAYYEWGLQPWDMAAGALVCTEAGAIVTGRDGQPPGERFVLAAHPRLHREVHALLVGFDAGL